MYKKLLNLLKGNYGFYLSLVFFIFPLAYVIDGTYPKYILLLTFLALSSYIGILYTKNKILIFTEWFYLIAYISYMTIILYPMNILFSFYLSNLLVWHFHDKYFTYRTISFFITINCLTLYIISNPKMNIGDRIILFIFSSMCIITYFFQKYGYERNKLKNERIKHNEHINLLLAENERNRIGRDLHDSIGHTFVMLKLKAELAEKYLDKNNIEAAKKELQEISEISSTSMTETRSIINKLKHRSITEELKVITDIMTMADISLDIKNNMTTLPSELVEWTITMVLKELTNNVIKHSKANKCNININESSNNYTIIVSDNGRGFENIDGKELSSIRDRIILFIFSSMCIITYFFQKYGYERNKLKNERLKHNEHINLLLAENERNRIGRDLHDSIGHTFVMLKLKAELAEKYLEKNNIEAAKKELKEISEISSASMTETRSIINKLKHRSINEELKVISDIMTMADIALDINTNMTTSPSQLVEWTITMVLKELTNNVIKHSNANKCNIEINESSNNYTVIISDNGRGFESIDGTELASIRERIKLVNGVINKISKKSPTTIEVTINK